MRFVMVPAEDNAYDWRMLKSFARALEEAGHQVKLLPFVEYTLGNVSSADIVFDINRARPGWLPPGIMHIAWVQDFIPGSALLYGERKRSGDMLYVLTNPEAQGVEEKYVDGALLTAVDYHLLLMPPVEQTVDLSLCGFIPPPMNGLVFVEVRGWPDPGGFAVHCHKRIAQMYTPLRGDLRCVSYFNTLHEEYLRFVQGHHSQADIEDAWSQLMGNVGHWTMDHPRRLDRHKLGKMVLSVTENCLFQGKNWTQYGEFAAHAMEHTNKIGELLDVYQRSRINLHTNSDGYGPHSRVLEAMAVGGFIMTHSVERPERPGCMHSAFTPDVHYAEFDVGNFAEKVKFWLQNKVARDLVAKECRGLIESKHLWRHRAAQLLKDLGLSNSNA